jgi:hypothetical protein
MNEDQVDNALVVYKVAGGSAKVPEKKQYGPYMEAHPNAKIPAPPALNEEQKLEAETKEMVAKVTTAIEHGTHRAEQKDAAKQTPVTFAADHLTAHKRPKPPTPKH